MDQALLLRFKFIAAIRQFFNDKNFMDVLTPPMMDCPVIEPHIRPFRVRGKNLTKDGPYLQTSPEFWMKYLLSEGFEQIFTINYCFRDGPKSPLHRPQFLMLEWYRAHEPYEKIAQDIVKLAQFLQGHFNCNSQFLAQEMTVQELFDQALGVDILELLEKEKIRNYIEQSHDDIILPRCQLSWEDYYHLLFLNKITPFLKQYEFLVLKEYPAPLKALARLKEEDPRVCERFELFIHGDEVANCYGELTDFAEQRRRFDEFNQERSQLYGEQMPLPRALFYALKRGIPPCSGAALGIERLMRAILKMENPFFIEESSLDGEF